MEIFPGQEKTRFDLNYWLQSRRRHRQREKSLIKAGAETEPGKNNGAWIEAVVENGSPPRAPAGAMRIYFAGGAYCQRFYLIGPNVPKQAFIVDNYHNKP